MNIQFFHPRSFWQPSLRLLLVLGCLLTWAAAPLPAGAVLQETGPTATSTPLPPETTPTSTLPPATSTAAAARPLVSLEGYSLESGEVKAGEVGRLHVRLGNAGQTPARNLLVSFQSGELALLETGGVMAVLNLEPGAQVELVQPFSAPASLAGREYVTLGVQVAYVDELSSPYSGSFQLNMRLKKPVFYRSAPTATPTPTPTPSPTPVLSRPQLLVIGFTTDLAHLQAGAAFELSLQVMNLGMQPAKHVTMILGGGTSSYAPEGNSTRGISGADADMEHFAPLAGSNLHALGDLAAGGTAAILQALIVNADTPAGAHSLKVSFAYFDETGSPYLDDQVITLLVQHIPRLEVNFYRQTGVLQVGQPGTLPLQILNLDRMPVMVDRITVSSLYCHAPNPSVYVGAIDAGGYFTQDVTVIPEQPGTLEISVLLEYMDDFNQPQTIEKTLVVEAAGSLVQAPAGETSNPPDSEQPPAPSVEPKGKTSLLDTVWRLLLGFLGLDSRLDAGQA